MANQADLVLFYLQLYCPQQIFGEMKTLDLETQEILESIGNLIV